ncbi:MAG: hypothetical protein SH868_11150 [Bythopirellula sp.]|nr:hypothetical protein [Bythopirellula sp.]
MLTSKRIYAMLGNESLWDAAVASHELLASKNLPHAILGGVAVCLHGYQRNTIDVDLLIRAEDANTVRESMTAAGWQWDVPNKQFISGSGVILQFLLSGERAGLGSEVCLPDPTDANSVTELEGLPVLTLARLIETKIACGQNNARRMHKDFADVVELIAVHDLNSSFARKLHKSLQPIFRQLMANARGE